MFFSFGKNFITNFNESYSSYRLELAKKSLQDFLRVKDLKGKTFLDVGSGNAMYSISALQLNAEEVLSFDLNDECIECCKKASSVFKNDGRWKFQKASIFDHNFTKKLEKYDIVYAWGVVHHSGNMWEAIDIISNLVRPNGLLYIGIYNKADGFAFYPDGRFGPSIMWKHIKKNFSKIPSNIYIVIELILIILLLFEYIITLKNPIKKLKETEDRGMNWRLSLRDWLCGYPYEYASVNEVFDYFYNNGFKLENINCNNGLRTNEYLFRKTKFHNNINSKSF